MVMDRLGDDLGYSYETGGGRTSPRKKPPLDTERQATWRFQEQSYLMQKIDDLLNSRIGDPVNYCKIVHSRPEEYINLLFNSAGRDADKLFALNSAQMSLLVPKVKVFKEYKEPTTGESESVEITFDDYLPKMNIEDIIKSGVGRGGGVGLKSFSWKSLGTNTANRFTFEAKLKLYFQNLEDLFKVREVKYLGPSKRKVEIRYSDLILQNREYLNDINEGGRVYNKDYYSIKVICGWYSPMELGLSSEAYKLIPQNVWKVLRDTKVIHYMTLKNHEFDYKDDGSVELTANYVSYTEALMHDWADGNVLRSPEEESLKKTKNSRAKARARLNQLTTDIEDEETKSLLDKRISELEREEETLDNRSLEGKYSRFVTELLERGKIYTIASPHDFYGNQVKIRMDTGEDTTIDQIDERNRQVADTLYKNQEIGSSADPTLLALAGNEEDSGLDSEISKLRTIQEVAKAEDDEDYMVQFFYLGDLLDILLDPMYNKQGESGYDNKDLKVLVGNVSFYDYGMLEDSGYLIKVKSREDQKNGYKRVYTGKRRSVNIADIPISLKLFTTWFLDTIVDKRITDYSLKSFIEAVINDLLIRAVSSEWANFSPRQQIRMSYRPFVAVEDPQRTASITRNRTISIEEARSFGLSVSQEWLEGSKKLENYLLIYGNGEYAFSMTGDYEQDRKKGIYHLFFGEETGLVRNINFKREDMPYMRESNIYASQIGVRTPSQVLREKYNASIEMFGNNIFEVGGKVKITPLVYGKQAEKYLSDLGLGGYYDVIGIESVIESGIYKTSLDARWVGRGDGTMSIGERSFLPSNIPVTTTEAVIY